MCTYSNPISMRTCEMCQTSNPNAKPEDDAARIDAERKAAMEQQAATNAMLSMYIEEDNTVSAGNPNTC